MKEFSVFCRPLPLCFSSGSPPGGTWGAALTNTSSSAAAAKPCGERGFLLLFLCPLLLLGLLFLMGTMRTIRLTQERVAIQSRLDQCAVKLAVGREHLFRHLKKTNQWLSLTAKGVAMARGLMIISGPAGALAGKLGESALLAANRAAYLAQELAVNYLAASELTQLRCRPSPFSRHALACYAAPALPGALVRSRAIMPDLYGELKLRDESQSLSQVRCLSANWPPLKTTIEVAGDPLLSKGEFSDAYTE